jgi:hypothetical protein
MKKIGEFADENKNNVNESLSGKKEKMSKTTKAIIIGGICFGVIILAIIIFIVSIPLRIFNTSSKLINNVQDTINNQMEHMNEEMDDAKNQMDSHIDDMKKNDSIMSEKKNQILSEANKQKARIFNSDFEIYTGTKQKMSIETLLDKVVTNNKKEKEHIITVKYNETVSNNTEDIVKLKHSLEAGKKYEILLDYDETGYVNQVTIIDI